MNNTPPRGPGGFPATPQTAARGPSNSTSTPNRPNVRSPLADVPKAPPQSSSGPLLSTDILDAASQRFYVFAFYTALWAYRLYDFYTLNVEQDESLWLCLKWVFFDMVFMFGIPVLEIPWLEWSNSSAFALFAIHAVLDFMLMFRVGVPVYPWLVGLAGFLWDSEMAISEHSVKPGPIIHNASLILGKQIINILPEGSAVLNPNQQTFCLNSSVTQLDLPILINQTYPIDMEFLRIDVESGQNETVPVKKSELKSMLKKAKASAKSSDPAEPWLLHYPVKKSGIYLLKKVMDQSKLEVRPRSNSVVVATCPQAQVRPTGDNRCRNDLSNVALEVQGIPPLHVRYRLNVNDKPRGGSEFQNLQPEDSFSPLSRHTSQALIKTGREDVSWAQSQKVTVPLNETLLVSGRWEYAVEEVQDGLGNFVSYVNIDDDDRPKAKVTGVQQSFQVHERPRANLHGCTPQSPLRRAKGDVARLPVEYASTGKDPIEAAHSIQYMFTPEQDLVADGYHSSNAEIKKQKMRSAREQPLISAPGLYTIKSIETDFCEGEVLEPTSCLLQNPPEPDLALNSEDIVDKCAGNPIGLRVALDLVGSPPFQITYTEHRGKRKEEKALRVGTLRSTIELTPGDAGHYKYTFDSIRDDIYPDRPLNNLILQQDVKPSAHAHFIEGDRPKQACIDDTAEFDVVLQGEGPWTLEYELIHNGKRVKDSVKVEQEHFTIKTQPLKSGGEYSLALTSITDGMGCKEFLKEEAKVKVRHERPKAYFGHIEGKQSVRALEERPVDLPLRLTGTGPWQLEFENVDTNEVKKQRFQNENSLLEARADGTYHLLSVRDSVCPGYIDESASQFAVSWIPRPKLSVPESAAMVLEGSKYVKEPVCEGDEDSFDISLSGHPPFDVSYSQKYKDQKGKVNSVSEKEIRSSGGSASVHADTSKFGVYEYTFQKLSDNRYDHSKKHFTPVTVEQTVNPRPNARFNSPGKTYSYCSQEADGEEVIPMTLEGVAPFYLEVEIKHHSSSKPELSVHKNITSNKYDLKIEHRKLQLGHSSISIRKIRDARGCGFKPPTSSPRVQISVHDAPTAVPLEDRQDYCVGERLAFALSGQVPFTVYYTFEGQDRKAANSGTTFRRLAELPGTFTITGLRDSASECLASLAIPKTIHPIPSVRLSGGQVSEIDIHEGGNTDLEFQFWGTPPFEFTYTRSTNAGRGGRKSRVLEIRTEVSQERELRIPVQEEGTYEVVSIKDRWCSFARGVEGLDGGGAVGSGGGGQKMLTY